jgi:hypothetical protein
VRRALATVPASLTPGWRRLISTAEDDLGDDLGNRGCPPRTRPRRSPGSNYASDGPPPAPTTDSLAAGSTVRARHQHDGRRSLPPTAQTPMPRSEQETWRERPRCARWKWPRACPEGSLTPWVSVSCVGRLRVCARSRNRRESGPHVRAERNADIPDNPVSLVREILVPELHSFRTR